MDDNQIREGEASCWPFKKSRKSLSKRRRRDFVKDMEKLR